MKKLLLLFAFITASLVWAQTQNGNFVLETAVLSNNTAPNTGFGFSKITDGGGSLLNVGVNGGYFVQNNLAVKAGVGYGATYFDGRTLVDMWSFRAGMEYHINGHLPVEVAWTGVSSDAKFNPSYLSTQVGYNWFVNKNVGIKPLVRYDISLTDKYKDIVSFGVGFGFYFN